MIILLKRLFSKLKKAATILSTLKWELIKPLLYGTAASTEHFRALKSLQPKPVTVIDIGANRGQFALAARHAFPSSKIYSFEPLEKPIERYKKLLKPEKGFYLSEYAIGSIKKTANIHVSASDDSSSLLPITSLQSELYPGTQEVNKATIDQAPLDYLLEKSSITQPALLKLDVQGFELEALKGCYSYFELLDWIYVECSFLELYEGQALASDVLDYMTHNGFKLTGIFNISYGRLGHAIQADFLFTAKNHCIRI